MPDAALDIITTVVHPNEVCMGMRQGPVGERWIERVWVVRGDTIARYETDRGPASLYENIPEEIIPGDGETTVAEFMDEAARHRTDLRWWRHLVELQESSTLIADINRQREARREYIHNRSHFGPNFKIERSFYNRENTWRKAFDRRAELTGKRVFTS
jgi:hypothetical protein